MANVKISQLTPKGANLEGTDLLEISEFDGSGYVTRSITGQEIIDAASGGGVAWGDITGTLSSQTDLQSELDGKFDVPTGDTTQYLDGAGTPTTFPTFASADKMVTVGRNSTGATLYKGTIVYISGSTGNRPNFVKAQANSEATSAGTFGVIEADIPNNSDGNCVTIGTIDNLDTRVAAPHPFTTNTLLDGDTIYLSPTTAGYVTNVKPSAPNHMVYVGKVVRTSPTNGTIVYRIQNGYELEELHNVTSDNYTTPQDEDSILTFNSMLELWSRLTLSNLYIYLKNYFDIVYQSILVSGTNIKTINGSSVLGSGNLTISGGGGTSVPIPQVPTIGYMNSLYNTNSAAPTIVNNMYLFPFIPMNDINTSSIIIQVTTAQAASTGKMVVYSSTSQGLPSTLLVESTALDCSTTGFKTFSSSQSYTANTKYWIGFVGSVSNINTTSNSMTPIIGVRTNANSVYNCLLFSITYPTIPATVTTSSASFNNQASCPRITFVQ